MQKLKVAASALLKDKLQVEREVVCLSNADFTEVSAVVIDIEDYRKGGLNKVNATALEIPVFLYLRDEDTTPEELVGHVVGVINDDLTDRRLFGRQIDEAAKRFASVPSLWPMRRAGITFVSLMTRQSPFFKYCRISRKCRWLIFPVSLFNTRSLDAARSSKGSWAISSWGNSKLKSVTFMVCTFSRKKSLCLIVPE